MKKQKRIIFLFYCLTVLSFFIFLFFDHAFAGQNDNLLISEIYPYPNENESEFIELYNPFDTDIDLTNYSIEDGTNINYLLDGLSINAKNYLILKKGVDFSFGLNNDGDVLVLKHQNNIIDQVAYGNYDDGQLDDNAKKPSKGMSLTRNGENFDSNCDNLDFIIAMPSPNKKYEKIIYSNNVLISEVCPYPENGSENEYIELFNSGNENIDLSFWQLDDGEGGSSFYIIPSGTIILPNQYLVFYKNETGIALNDDGDNARLIDPGGDIKQNISYEKSEKGLSYSLKDSQWFWSEVLSPGKENKIVLKSLNSDNVLENIIKEDILSVRSLENGALVKVTGVITVVPGILSAQFFYIQDNASGIQIYCYKKDFPLLSIGDKISVVGELSEANGEKRVKIKDRNDVLIIEKSAPLPPILVNEEITEKYEGLYVKISGKVVKTSGSTFVVDTGADKILVNIKKQTGIKKPKMRKGDIVEVSGIVSEYKGEYRILPFSQDNVKIIYSSYLPRAGISIFIYLYIVFGSIILWNIYQRVSKKLINLQKMLR